MRKCRAVNVSREDLKEILPDDIFKNVNKSYLTIQCEEDGHSLAYALIQAGKNSTDSEVTYVDYDVEEDVLEEVISELFKGVREILFRAGIKTIGFSWCDEVHRMDRILRVMLKNGFLPVRLTGTISGYSFEKLAGVNNLNELEKLQNKGEFQFIAPEKTKPQLKWFFRVLKEYGIELSPEMYEAAFSRFYKDGDQLRAYVIGAKTSEKTLYLERVYMDGTQKGAIALTLMLSEILKTAKKMFSGDSHFFVYTDDISVENMIYVLLDEPMKILQAHEYLCINPR